MERGPDSVLEGRAVCFGHEIGNGIEIAPTQARLIEGAPHVMIFPNLFIAELFCFALTVLLILAVVMAWSERMVATLDRTRLPGWLRWVTVVWPYRIPILAGVAVLTGANSLDVTTKDGRSGRLVFVKVRHEIRRASAKDPALTEFHDIVYREAATKDDVAPPPKAAPAASAWERKWIPDDVLLFRYSALTFNGHRIHYDRRYVTEVEGYPGLVVHGPLLALLALELPRLHASGRAVRQVRSPPADRQKSVPGSPRNAAAARSTAQPLTTPDGSRCTAPRSTCTRDGCASGVDGRPSGSCCTTSRSSTRSREARGGARAPGPPGVRPRRCR